MADGVFCDFLGVTFDHSDWPSVRSAIEPCLDSFGASLEFDADGTTLWRSGDGTIRAKRFGSVMSLGASGAACAALRVAAMFGNYLAAIGSVPHTVTRLDASIDLVEDTPAVIDRLVSASETSEGIALTRKRVRPRDVTRLLARRSDGKDTGTCYIGSRNAEVRAAVYDKREERLSRGLCDVGPLTRYELRLKSGVGATLRDALVPDSIFWHFMSPSVLPHSPPGVSRPWVSHAGGFEVERPDLPLPAARLRRRLDASPEVRALLRLVDEIGPGGFDFLVHELRRLQVAVDGVQGPAPAVTALLAS